MKKKNSIPLKTAISWTKFWKKLESNYSKCQLCRAANITNVDLYYPKAI